MTYTYHYKKCTACNTSLLADDTECWYCGGDELEEKTVEWADEKLDWENHLEEAYHQENARR